MHLQSKKLIVLCGLPGTGKSTETDRYRKLDDWFVYSTDDYLEAVAEYHGTTYNEVFEQYIKQATSEMNQKLADAIAAGKSIIWDQTNLSRKKRKKILRQVGDTYKRECWYFPLYAGQYENWRTRLNKREGKHITDKAVKQMIEQFEQPLPSEGFDQVLVFDNGLP